MNSMWIRELHVPQYLHVLEKNLVITVQSCLCFKISSGSFNYNLYTIQQSNIQLKMINDW